MPYSVEHKCLFVHIPKTAGSSIGSRLAMHGDVAHVGLEPYVNQRPNEESMFGAELSHLTLTELSRRIEPDVFDSLFSFSIVRHPLDRLVSHAAWAGRKWARGEALDRDWFREFVTRAAWRNRHLRPQHEFLNLEGTELAVDYIGRFEDLPSAWHVIQARLGLTPRPLEYRMRSFHGDFMDYYDRRSLEIACERYASDFDLLGYELP